MSGGGGLGHAERRLMNNFCSSLEVVDEGLNGPNRWVGTVPIDKLPGEVRRDASIFCDLVPLGWPSLSEAMNEGVEDCAHAPLFPVYGKLSTHRREADAGTSLPTGLQMERLMLRPSNYGVAAMTARETLAQNLRALMDAHPSHSSTLAIERATDAGGMRVGKSTIDRALKCETILNLDYIEAIARVFGLDAWQILTPGLRPKTPPVLRSIGDNEDQLYKKLADLAKEITELQKEGR